MPRKNPDTSNEAYRSITPEMLTDIYKKILSALKIKGKSSGQQIATHLKLDDNKISRRLKEMEGLGLIYNTKIKVPTKSGRSAFQWDLQAEGTKYAEQEVNYKKQKETVSTLATDMINSARPKYVEQQLF